MKFCQHTADSELHIIETKKILSEVVHDNDATLNYSNLLGETEMLVNSDVAKTYFKALLNFTSK